MHDKVHAAPSASLVSEFIPDLFHIMLRNSLRAFVHKGLLISDLLPGDHRGRVLLRILLAPETHGLGEELEYGTYGIHFCFRLLGRNGDRDCLSGQAFFDAG